MQPLFQININMRCIEIVITTLALIIFVSD